MAAGDHHYFESFEGDNFIQMANEMTRFINKVTQDFEVTSVSHSSTYVGEGKPLHFSAIVACVRKRTNH